MGLLETRNLDFDHLLVLSANEGNIPRGVSDSSFIPYSIRKAFGLTTVDNKVAIYAYYFYRLLARATDITLVYNNATSDGQTGEMSRFMLQLLVEGLHPIRQFTIQAKDHDGPQTELRQQPHPIEKTHDVVELLKRRFDIGCQPPDYDGRPLLTPTAINRYMRCQLQFYYNYVEGLREPDETEDDVIDSRIFGNIFHEAAQTLYQQLTQKSPIIRASDLEQLLRQKVDIERCVDNAISKELFRVNHQRQQHKLPELNGLQIINRQVIIHYLRTLFEIDRKLAPFNIIGLETDVTAHLHIASIGITTTIGGRIDRLDAIQNPSPVIRVIDYKTGSKRIKPLKNIEAVFDPSQLHNHNDYYLQALLYARLAQQRPDCRQMPVSPALLFIQHAAADQYNPILQIGSDKIIGMNTPYGDRFVELLKEKIEEIFNPDISFQPTVDPDVCRTCPYQQFCGLP
jgi:CRISPR/Cas system-associated exonuclease Cas4 (RecB family)